MKIAVVGGGISGSSAAYLLKKKGHDVLLVEAVSIGGKAKTIYESGYTIESGPNGFLDNKEEIKRLITESGFEDEVIESSEKARRRFIFSSGRLHELPENPLKLLTGNFLSLKAKLNLLREPFVAPVLEDETLAGFVRRRLGDEILNKLIGPMACGVYAGDPEYMSMDATFSRIKEIERRYGSLIRGLLSMIMSKKASASSASGPFSAKLLSFKRGVGSFVTHLASNVTKIVSRVVSVCRKNGKYRLLLSSGSLMDFDGIVFAVPAYSLASVIKGYDRGFAACVGRVRYAPLSVVVFGFEGDSLPDVTRSFGYLFELSSIKDVIGVLFDSSIFDYRASSGKLLVRLMVGGDLRRESALSGDIIAKACKELQRSAGIFKPFRFSRVFRHPLAIPQYGLEHSEIVSEIFEFEKRNPGLFVTGNAFFGVSLNDCVKSSYELTERM